ncbi:unnamed protein product [Dicrocoelium dendriticum]|nr:unnamed protein product [Dicrocoelium dendriticum]
MDQIGHNGSQSRRIRRVPLLSRETGCHPLCKNVLFGMTMMMLGEVLAENLKHCFSFMTRKRHSEPCGSAQHMHTPNGRSRTQARMDALYECWQKRTFSQTKVDFMEVGRLGLVGAFQGFYQHFYYTWLDKKLLGNSITVVAKKVILDELGIAPTSIFLFFLTNFPKRCE